MSLFRWLIRWLLRSPPQAHRFLDFPLSSQRQFWFSNCSGQTLESHSEFLSYTVLPFFNWFSWFQMCLNSTTSITPQPAFSSWLLRSFIEKPLSFHTLHNLVLIKQLERCERLPGQSWHRGRIACIVTSAGDIHSIHRSLLKLWWSLFPRIAYFWRKTWRMC